MVKGRPQRALIGNVHLESLNSHPIRVQQLHTCRAALAEAAAAARAAGEGPGSTRVVNREAAGWEEAGTCLLLAASASAAAAARGGR